MSSPQAGGDLLATVWPADSPVAQVLISVILCLLVWALACAIFHTLRLAREERALGRVAAKLRAWRQANLMAGPAPAAPGAGTPPAAERYPRLSLEELRGKLGELQAAAGQRTHVARLVDMIHKLRTHRVKINLATLQQLVEHDEATQAGASAPHHVANFVIMIGILGTFWGLGHMVRAIGVALPDRSAHVSAETWTRSFGQIRTVLEGMRTAFSASLVGMATAIVTGLFGVFLGSRQQRLLTSIEAFAVNDLLPATVPTLDDDSILEQVSGQLESAFSRIDGIAAQNLDAIQEFTAAQATFRALVEDIRAIAHAEASRDLERVLASVVGSNEGLLELLRGLPPVLETKHEIEEIRAKLDGTNQALRELVTALPQRFDPGQRLVPWNTGAAPYTAPLATPLRSAPRPTPLQALRPMLVPGLIVIGVGFLMALFTALR